MLERYEQARRRQDDQTENDGLGGGSADIAEYDLERRYGCRQQLVDGADEPREVDAEGGVGDALRQQREHDQAGHDEGAVADAVHLGDARADGRAEHHEIQGGREHRREDALHQGAPRARHLEQIDRPDCVEIHLRAFHQIDEDVLERALRGGEVLEGDAGRAEVLQQRGDAGALGLRVVGIDQLAAIGRKVPGRDPAARAGVPCGPCAGRA